MKTCWHFWRSRHRGKRTGRVHCLPCCERNAWRALVAVLRDMP